jgi:hypothetical protein
MCDSQDLTLQAILSNGVATVRQTLSRVFSAMAAEWAKKGRKLVLRPGFDSYASASPRGRSCSHQLGPGVPKTVGYGHEVPESYLHFQPFGRISVGFD